MINSLPIHLTTDPLISKTYETNCLNVALTFKIPDLLKEKPSGMHISEIGEKTGLEERKAGRILRLLATNHVFREGPSSTHRFTTTFSSDMYPSVRKCFHKQSVEHSTPLDQPIVQYGASLVGFIYLENPCF